jgi:transcriptional regulator NrdR family protein
VRFASVYRDFQDVEEFEQELARMEDLRRTGVR